jgi:NADH-quinone oxidoreductase subunit M
MITTLTLIPLIGALIVACSGRERTALARWIGFAFSLAALALALALWTRFDSASADLQFVKRYAWIPSVGAEYFVGIDGLSLLMVLLTCVVIPFALLTAWKFERASNAYVALMLSLQCGLIGTFTALNFFHWFIFWELSLVPAYFLIKLWGGPMRSRAANQFFVYTLVGSVTLLLSFLAMYWATKTFDFVQLAEMGRSGELTSKLMLQLGWYRLSTESLALVIFAGALLGFAVKVPLFPFHTWLPATYSEAPSSTSMVLTGVLSKMGVYGFLRILLPIFPEQMRMMLTPLLWLSVATIVFSAFAAFAQRDIKRMLGYSSINHLGYCLLGLFAAAKYTGTDPALTVEKTAALNGVLLQMFNHGITASALFCFVAVLEHRLVGRSVPAEPRGIREYGSAGTPRPTLYIDSFAGLRQAAPIFCGLMGIAAFASIGLPGLNGFVGEFLIFKGAFPLAPWAIALALLGLLATAVFLITLMQRVFHGPSQTTFADLRAGEWLIVAPAIAMMFVLGIWPKLILKVTNATVANFAAQLAN